MPTAQDLSQRGDAHRPERHALPRDRGHDGAPGEARAGQVQRGRQERLDGDRRRARSGGGHERVRPGQCGLGSDGNYDTIFLRMGPIRPCVGILGLLQKTLPITSAGLACRSPYEVSSPGQIRLLWSAPHPIPTLTHNFDAGRTLFARTTTWPAASRRNATPRPS